MNRLLGRPKVLHINVPQPVEFHANSTVERIVGVTRVACFVHGDAMVLKMGRRNVHRVVNKEATSVRLHDVAGEAKIGLLGALKMHRSAPKTTQNGQREEGYKGKDFAASGGHYRRARKDRNQQYNCDTQEDKEDCKGAGHVSTRPLILQGKKIYQRFFRR